MCNAASSIVCVVCQSDDEGLEEERLTDRTFGRVSEASPIEDASERVYQSMQLQVGIKPSSMWAWHVAKGVCRCTPLWFDP